MLMSQIYSSLEVVRGLLPLSQSETGYSLKVKRSNCIGAKTKHMAGGATTAALIAALEHSTNRKLITAATQFIESPVEAEPVAIEVEVLRSGRSISQARASMVRDAKVLVEVMATLGSRSGELNRCWPDFPSVSTPLESDRVGFIREDEGDQHSYLDVRIARLEPEHGTVDLWFYAGDLDSEHRSPFLALIADYLPEAQQLLTRKALGGTSLDNQLRIISDDWSDWILCSMQMSALRQGLFHGTVRMWSQSAKLLAEGSQSGVTLNLGSVPN